LFGGFSDPAWCGTGFWKDEGGLRMSVHQGRPDLRFGETFAPGAMYADELIREVCERAGYTHLGTLAGRLPLREWLERLTERWDWPMVFRDGWTHPGGPALISAATSTVSVSSPQYCGVFPLFREAAGSS